MTITFYVGFRSQPEESVALRLSYNNKLHENTTVTIPLQYHNEVSWSVNVDTAAYHDSQEFEYSYIYINDIRNEQIDFCKRSTLSLKKLETKHIDVIDQWRDDSHYEDVFSSRPFLTVLNPPRERVK